VANRGKYLNLRLFSRKGRAFRGLLGDADGVTADDFRLRDGTVLARPLDKDAWKAFSGAWRVSAAESLFVYGPGQDTSTFTDLAFPYGPATTGNLSAAAYRAARATCLAAGITNEALLEACIVDVGTTGDADFAMGVSDLPAPVAGSPAIYGLAVAADSLKPDRVSTFALTADGTADGVFEATVRGPLDALALVMTDPQGQPMGGQVWDTVAANAVWVLGVEENGVLVNNADGSIAPLSGDLHKLRFYANGSGHFVAGQHFRLQGTAGAASLAGPLVPYQLPVAVKSCPAAAAQWSFEEGTGTNAADSSGHGHTLDLTATRWALGYEGTSALTFDGATSYAATPADPGITATRKLTVTAWINQPALVNGYGGLVAKGKNGGSVQDWGFYTYGGELAALFNWPTGPQGSSPTLSSGARLTAGVWSFVALVLDVDAGKYSFYKDGQLVSSVPWTMPLLQNPSPITLGSDAGSPNHFRGDLDGVAVWTTALSATDIAALYAGQCPP
jgi:hypothetical protein